MTLCNTKKKNIIFADWVNDGKWNKINVAGYRYLVIYREANRHCEMWFGSSVIECRDSIPEALGSNPSRARYFSPPVTFGAQSRTTHNMIGYCFGTSRTTK